MGLCKCCRFCCPLVFTALQTSHFWWEAVLWYTLRKTKKFCWNGMPIGLTVYHICQRHLCCFECVVYEYHLLFPAYSKNIVEWSFLSNVMMCPRHSFHEDRCCTDFSVTRTDLAQTFMSFGQVKHRSSCLKNKWAQAVLSWVTSKALRSCHKNRFSPDIYVIWTNEAQKFPA